MRVTNLIDRFVLWLARKNGTVEMWWMEDVKGLIWVGIIGLGYLLYTWIAK